MKHGTSSPELTEVSAQDWQEARRRLEIIQPLAACEQRTRSSVRQAAQQLQLSVTHAYRLLKRYDLDSALDELVARPQRTQAGP